jgi:hypothetical protein
MATIGIGDYEVVILDGRNREVARVLQRGRSGRPIIGETIEVTVDGKVGVYQVLRSHHALDVKKASLEWTYPLVFVRRSGQAGPPPPGPGDELEERGPSLEPVTGFQPKVLPFPTQRAPFSTGLSSVILPVDLVLALVAIGYRRQAAELEEERYTAGAMLRGGQAWLIAPGAPDTLHTLGRTARFHYETLKQLIRERAAGCVPKALPSVAPSAAITRRLAA